MDATRLPMDQCPTCAYRFDAATSADDKPVSPQPGDLSICLNCGEALVFGEDLRYTIATQETITRLDNPTRSLLARAQTVARQFAIERKEKGEVLPSLRRS